LERAERAPYGLLELLGARRAEVLEPLVFDMFHIPSSGFKSGA
jgi:hypothetical protein